MGVEDNEGYSVEDGEATNADTYIAYVSLDSKQNYVWEDGTTDDLEIEYVIALRQIEVVIDDQDVIYGDEEEALTYTVIGDLASNQEDEDVFTITRVAGDNVGTYDITLTQLDDNYNITSNTATYTIEKYEITGIDFDDQVVEYDGLAHKLEITGTLPEGVEVTYTPTNEYTEKGVYDIEASFTDTTGNYIVPEDMMATLEIYVSVKGISLNETSLRLDPNDTYTLVATLNPIDPTNDAVIWVSTDDSVVEVDQDGNLVALEVGHAVVVVTTIEGGFSAICSVEVSILPESVEITNTEEELLTTDVLALNAVVYPLDATYQNVTWTSSDTNIATVDNNGVVTPVEPGFVTITVTTVVGNYEDEITIEIVQLAEEILLNRETASIVETYSLQLIATIKPNDTTNKSVIWSSSNETVATVDQNGLVEALSEGTTTITVKTLDGTNLSESCEITVTKLPVHAETVTIERTDSGTVLVDENVYLKAVVEPVDITDTITWATSDETIASVSQAGVVTALNSGTVTITAYVGKDTIYEKKATYEVEIFKHATNIFGLNNLEITYGTAYEFDPIASSGLTVDVKYYEGLTLLDEKPVNAGTYRVVASVESNYKYEAKEVEATLTINKVQLEKPLANVNNTFTYNKGNHTYTLETSDYYTITGNVNKNAGNYEALVTIKDTVNYEWIDGTTSVLSFPYVINKAKVNTPTANTGLVYNGLEQTGVNEDDRYTIEDGKATNADTYFAQVTLKDTSNYEWLDSSFDGSVMWSIEKAKYDMSGAYWSYTGPYTYDGQAHGVELKGLPTGVEVVYTLGSASAKNAGTYTARIDHFEYDEINYVLINNNVTSFTWIINKQELDMQDVAWDYDGAFAYNGSKHTVSLTDVPSEITVTYTENEATNAGTYVAVATFEYDAENYVLINNTVSSLTWNIERVNKTIAVNDILVAKGESYSVTYVEGNKETLPEYSLPEGFVASKVYDLAALKPAIQGTTGEVEVDSKIFNIDATNGKFVYADHNQWIQVNEGTIITFEVSQGSQISYVANNPTAFVSSVNGTTATIEAVGNDWLRTITVSNSVVVSEPAKMNVAQSTEEIQGTTGTWGPLSIDATHGKWANNNGGWIQVNAGTIITFNTFANAAIDMDVYSSLNNFKVTNNEGLVTIEVLVNDYIKNIYVRKSFEAKESEVEYFLGEQKVSKPTEKGIYTIKVNAEVEENYKGYDEASLEIFVKAASVTLDYSSASVALNGTLKLNATVNPDDTNDQRVVWSSNNEAVATVDQEGNITPVSEGETTITVTTVDGGHTATCVVRVTPRFLPATDVELSQAEDITTMKVGDTLALTATFTPADHTDNVKWTSSNANIASVHNGVVTAHQATNEPIIITVEAGNVSATYTITSITKVETTITDLNDVTATYGDDYVVAPETNSDGKMTITYVGIDNEYNSTTKPTNAGKYNIEVVVEETTKYTSKSEVVTLTINKKQVEKDIYLGDMIVEKGEAFDINYVEKENTIPTLTIVDKTINLLESTEPIRGTVVEWNGLTIDTTAQGSYWGNNGSGWIMINAGTVVTFEVPEGATVTATEYQSADIARFNVEGTTCTLTVDRQTYLSEIRVVSQLEIKETGKVLASNFTGHIEGNRGEWGPFMVDATANGAKFKAHNGQYIQVNAGTVIRVQTVPGTYVDVETYEDKDILDVTVEEFGLATITVKENGYIEAINIMTPNKVLGEEGTVKFYNALDEEVTPNVNGTYKMVLTIGEDRNHIGVKAEATLTVITSVTGVELNKAETTLAVDGTEKLIATITPEDVTNSELVWSSSNNNVVVVDQDGNITALQPGEVTITVTTVDGDYTDTCVVTVSKYANTITAENQNTTYGENYEVDFEATANKENAVVTYYDGETKLDEKPTDAGTYRVVITVPATETYKEVTKEVTLTIAQRTIELEIESIETVYGTEEELVYDIKDGFSLADGDNEEDVFIVSRVSGEDVGTYAITVETLNNNYVVNYNSESYTIKAKDAEVIWANANDRTYTGNVFEAPTAYIKDVNNNDLPLVVTMTTEGVFKDVRKYNFSVTGVANYNLSNTTKVVEVKKATLTVNWEKQDSYTYGGELTAPSASVTTLEGEKVPLTPRITSGQDAFLNAGSYDFEVVYDNPNYIITNTTLKDVEIDKAVITWPEDLVLEATYGQTLSQVELPTSENGTWSFVDSTASVGSAGEHDILVKFTPKDNNYYAIESLVVKLNVSKLNNTVTGLNKVTVTYGDAIGFVYEASNKANATVKYYKDGELLDKEPTDAGTYQYELYIPSTDAYNEYTSEKYTLIINARQINVEIIVPEDLVYGNDYEVTATIIGLPNQFVKPEITLTYTGTANDGTEYNSTTAPTDAGTYKVTATIEDSNYSLANTSKDFNIGKATPDYIAPGRLEATIGTKLSSLSISLPEGWKWDEADPSTVIIDEDNNEFSATFTPEDTHNYLSITHTLTVYIVTIFNEILADDIIRITYGDSYEIEFEADNKIGATVNYYLGETKLDEEPTDAGTYKVLIHIPANDVYKEAQKTISLVIDKAAITWPEDLVLETTYGQVLSQVELPTSENGTWSFVDPTASVGSVGEHEILVKFTPKNNNYYAIESLVVKLDVSALEIEVEWSEDNYTYEGVELTLPTATYEGLEIVVSKVFNDEFKDAGEYAFSASVKDNNNYIIKNNEKSYKIKPREITVNIITHGGEVGNVRAAEVTFNNVIEGDDVDETITYVGTDYNSSEVPNAAGTYSVKVSINNDNYVLTGIVEAEFVVTEPAIPVENVSFEETLLNLEVGGSDYTLIPRINPNNATNTNVSWSVSPAGVVTVVDGVVTPVAKGEAIITVTTEDGNKTATCSVKVSQPVTSVDITTTETNYTTNDLVELEVEVGPENADNKTVTWTAEPTEVAEVNESGIVTPLKAGTVTITATAGNKSDSITLTFDQGLDHVVIYEVYGGGGNSGATYQNDYVVLYNPTLNDIDITGYKINKLSDEDAVSDTFTLVGKVESKKYYIVKLVAGSNEATKITEYNIYGTMLLSEKNISITLNDGENDIDTVKTGDILSSTKSYRRNADNLEFAVGEPNLSLYNDNLSTKVGIKSVTFNKDSAMKVDYKYSRSGKTLLELGLSTFVITFDNDYQLTIKAKFGDIAYLESVTSTFDSTQVTEEGQYQTVNFKYGSNDILGSVDVTVKADELTLTLQESLNLEAGSTIELIEKLTILDSAIYDESIPFEWVITREDGIITINEETDIMTAVSSGTVKIHAVYNGTIYSNECEVTVTPVVTAVFEFGDKDETQKGKESSTAISTYTETNNEYNLKLYDGVKMYNKSYDALGNSVLKLGSSSDVGSFNIVEIPSDIKTVVIYVSGRADSTANVSVNGVVYSLTTTSNSGSYTPIMVDSSINKTISFTSLKTGADERCMIDRIEYFEEKLVKDKLVESISLSPSTLTLEAGATSEKLVVTFTPADATNKNIIWTSSDDNVATVQDGVVTAKEPSETKTVTITAKSEDGGHIATCTVTVNAKVAEPDAPTTISKTIADYADANKWADSTQYKSIDLDNNITVTATGGGNTGKYYTNGENWRIYQNETPKITIAAEDKTIVSVKITYTVSNNGVLTLNGEKVVSDTVVTVNASSVEFGVGNTNTATNGQVRITAIEVVYESSEEETPTCEHTNTTTETVDATCTEDGTITVTCDDCSEIVSEEIILATGHTFVDGECLCGEIESAQCEHSNTTTTITATCIEDGFTTVTCDDCGETISSEVTLATGHEYIDGICNNCGVEKPKAWTLVTDVATLKAGDQIVIVAKDYNYALSTTQNKNNRGQAAVTKNGSTVTFGADVQIITLATGKLSGTFAFNTGDDYLCAASSSNNYLRTETTLSNNSSWKITITSGGVATIVAQGSYTRNTMQYNQSSSLFACYSSASQKAVCIYKLG